MPFTIVRNDIARVRADVLVNAANEALAPGGGVCGALFAGAGYDRMLEACRAVGRCPTGGAVTTESVQQTRPATAGGRNNRGTNQPGNPKAGPNGRPGSPGSKGYGPAGAAPHGRNRAAQGREGARGGRRR